MIKSIISETNPETNKEILKQRTNILTQNLFIILNILIIIILATLLPGLQTYPGVITISIYLTTSIKLYNEIKNKKTPQIYDWLKNIIKNLIIISILYLAVFALGWLGIIGFILTIIGFALYRTFGTKESRALYFETIDYGADTLRKMTGKKKQNAKTKNKRTNKK